ncbi:MAG: hypothetical protein KAT70_09640 [Thermoplasmata archaeon]|nr:hypothetical protein [Thermoplasmata archaeon]
MPALSLQNAPPILRKKAYHYLGSKYHAKYGGAVLQWLVEEGPSEQEEWPTRYSIFTNHFSRSIPMPAIYSTLEKMTLDNIVRIRKKENGAHCFALNPNYLRVLDSVICFLNEEGECIPLER